MIAIGAGIAALACIGAGIGIGIARGKKLFCTYTKSPENQQNFQWIVTSLLYTTTFSIKLCTRL